MAWFKVEMSQSGKNAAQETASYLSKAIEELYLARAELDKIKGMGAELFKERLDKVIADYQKAMNSFSKM